MNQPALEVMTSDELFERFVSIALAQDDALLHEKYGKYNHLYDQMTALERELRRRGSDARRVLLRAFEHPNAQVRLKAAIATLAVAPEQARQVLQTISDRNEYPQAADARGMMRALDEGTFLPS
jgi:hypothetical protein